MQIKKIDYRWALILQIGTIWRLLGPHSWHYEFTNKDISPKIQTFRTRQMAREAQGTCGYKKTKIVKVQITIEVI